MGVTGENEREEDMYLPTYIPTYCNPTKREKKTERKTIEESEVVFFLKSRAALVGGMMPKDRLSGAYILPYYIGR